MTEHAARPVESTACVLAELCLFGGPYVVRGGRRVDVPEGSKRLLVFIALHAGRLDRHYVAGTLWPHGDDERAAGNLRSALWRLKGAGIDLVEADKFALWLRPGTTSDIDVVSSWATRLISGRPTPDDLHVPQWDVHAMDLLPGWYDDWVSFERERVRQRLLHALEQLSRELLRLKRYAEAVEAAVDAVGVEPLRESAQRVLIEAHLAEHNMVEARRLYTRYRQLVRQELRIEPSSGLTRLVITAERPGTAGTSNGHRRPTGRPPAHAPVGQVLSVGD